MSITFTVSGKVPFPLDMLRYDACWPVTGEDAAEMEDSIHRRRDPKSGLMIRRRIKLTTSNESAPTVGRWESFLWEVEL